MDDLLTRLGVQAMNMAIRSGIALTSTYAFSQCSRLMKTVDDRGVGSELKKLQKVLDSKIKIVSPAIDLIEFKSGRGNACLESALPLAKGLHQDIIAMGRRVEQAADAGEVPSGPSRRSTDADQQLDELKAIIDDMKDLLARIDRDIPLLHMAITASGESLNSSMSPSISPSRLLQAGMFLTFGDTQFAADPSRPVQIGPSFTLSLFMLFVGHAGRYADLSPEQQTKKPDNPKSSQRQCSGDTTEPFDIEKGDRKPLWQEVIHKARVRLCRTPMDHVFDARNGFQPAVEGSRDFGGGHLLGTVSSATGRRNEYAYHLEIIEDLDDGRAHDDLDSPAGRYDDISCAGIRESIPIHQISKIFYADTGRILNISSEDGMDNNPVLLLKRDTTAKPPSQMQEEMMRCADKVGSQTSSQSGHDSDAEDAQGDIDRQLREESVALDVFLDAPESPTCPSQRKFPKHLDSEWIALEVFEDDIESSETEDGDFPEEGDSPQASPATPPRTPGQPLRYHQQTRASLDSELVAQIHNISLQPSPTTGASQRPSRPYNRDLATASMDNTDSFVQRSPFGGITTSLSLLEMLIRLTSLQEFQQASHLTIHDHILTFFLEETSTTGLKGEERLKARKEAKRRVGFDPYTDTPSRR
ncbi:RanGTP-binding protein [Colletotrichum sojae]|uniref:RanGTP-binding protein n=1 Tax=Colletotrichum sojae TaxID=2175907 RepID=A0A8H6JBM8_9PEZI|nr:RanGTP-binding protein [Colletotrichum sojae]